jgi:hypothetical protein
VLSKSRRSDGQLYFCLLCVRFITILIIIRKCGNVNKKIRICVTLLYITALHTEICAKKQNRPEGRLSLGVLSIIKDVATEIIKTAAVKTLGL